MMKRFFLKLTLANLLSRPLSTVLTIATLAAAIALISILLQFSAHTSTRLERDLANVDLVVGAKGSPLQLILSSLLHVDVPTGNIPLSEAQKIMRDPTLRTAVPLALGDSFRGFRIVGTAHEFLNFYQADLSKGQRWNSPQQVVIGALVADQLRMQLGQRFIGGHGLSHSDADLAQHDHAAYEVVGILERQSSIIDRLILTSVDSVWDAHESHDDMDDHHDEAHHEAHSEAGEDALADLQVMDAGNREITALLLRYATPIAAVRLPRLINDRAGLQAASPALEVTRLYNLSAGFVDAGKTLAALMTLIGGLSIFVAVSSAAVHKTYDVALLRTMGAQPCDIFLQQLGEGILIACLSAISGSGLAHGALMISASLYPPLAVFGLDGFQFFEAELLLIGGAILVAALAVMWPALNSFRVDPMLLLKRGR